MDLIKNENWDPYSSDMTLEEFYALMEMFDEGMLPLKSNYYSGNSVTSGTPSISALGANGPGIEEPGTGESSAAAEETYIPRTKFLFGGLNNYVHREGSGDNDQPLDYDTGTDYTPDDNYPSGLDPFGAGYLRPPKSWKGIPVTDTKTNRVVLVSEDANIDNPSVSGNVIQGLFASYSGYYVKQVTIDGANINVLGLIELGDRSIYYYLSAEEQNTQVSTTTLPDEAKFIIEYVPVEHQINYRVRMYDSTEYITDHIPQNVVFYGSNAPTEVSWVKSIFGASPPKQTTDGAYSFDAVVPYGYELQIFISIDMSIDIPYKTKSEYTDSFYVEINHTGTKQEVYDAWLSAYTTYLKNEGFIDDDVKNHITETRDADGNITLKWTKPDDPDKDAHDGILARMAERINDFSPHNNGYPLGSYPNYNVPGEGGFKIIPNSDGPTEHTMRETFYNHLVKANRTVTAVLKEQVAPTFDVSQVLQKSSGAVSRGGSAVPEVALQSIKPYYTDRDDYDYFDADYDSHAGNLTVTGSPLPHEDTYPNIKSVGRSYNWDKEWGESFKGKSQNMVYDQETGTYYYSWIFQTNTGDSFYLDAFEVNGIAITIPYFPKYNWNNSYTINGNPEKADAKHPYYTETTLADGAILRLEFLLGWNSQRQYRVTVTGARSNVVVTGLNLMQYNSGAPEFSTYSLTGVYSDQGGYSQTAPAIEYYDISSRWIRRAQGNVIVMQNNSGIDYNNADTDKHGANIRFQIADGYGNPYYMWTNRWGDPINDQASVTLDDEGNITSYHHILSLNDVPDGTKLDSRYIYDGGDGYYYIRVTNQLNKNTNKNYQFALLTVVARTIKYTVRYLPEYSNWNGFVLDSDSETGLVKLTEEWMQDHQKNEKSNAIDIDPESMPFFKHDPEVCALWKLAEDETGNVPPQYQDILHQYDDNDGSFYDLLFYSMATIASDTYGTIRPKDNNKNYMFQNWILVGEDFTPVKDENNSYIQFLGGAIDLKQYSDYAVKHTAFGNADTDVHVLRLMPVWKHIENPFTYNVVLNWVDNLGQLHMEDFSDYWDAVVTEMTVSGQVYVFLNKDAKPLRDWIANHPTYTFWNEVNNATVKEDIEKALREYIEKGGENDNYDAVLEALLKGTNVGDEAPELSEIFERLGKDVFVVKRDGGDIGIWMYEDKAGLVFQKIVKEEPFIPNDEFYFTITNARVGENYESFLTGTYNAYPQFVYDEDGNLRDRTDDDAWLVEFKNGEIVSIDGNEQVTYFTLKNGDGISLYVSDGQYTVTELGSKSGNAYKTSVTYQSSDGSAAKEGWIIPEDGQLVGSEKSVQNSKEDVQQVSATVNFEVGEQNVVQTLTFTNSTLSMRINCEVMAPAGHSLWSHNFGYQLQFTLPENETPPQDDGGNYYYNVTAYRKTGVDAKGNIKYKATSYKLQMESAQQITRSLGNPISPLDAGDNIWYGVLDANDTAFSLKDSDYYVIVLPAPNDPESAIRYTAIETEPKDGETWHLDGKMYIRSGDLALGVQTEETYINTVNKPSLYVTKRVVRTDGKQEVGSFTFTVTLSDTAYTDEIFRNGVATFSLKDNESKFLVLDIPADGSVTYTVAEGSYDGYTTTYTNETGAFTDGTMIRVDVVNTQIKPGPGYLAITETGGKPGETFLYKITNEETGEELIVSVSGGGKTIVDCPAGNYTVEEINNWAWRYEDGKCKQKMPITVNSANTLTSPAHADFTNERNKKVWLGGEHHKNNQFSFSENVEEII